jgi:hypothetical protein
LVDTREFQRLKRIRHLGLSSVTYHGSEHTRFGHSLGVFHLFERLVAELEYKGHKFSDEEKVLGGCTALLHDIGHGPLSHVLEGVLTPGKKHEDWTQEIILGPTEIHCSLTIIDSHLPEKICQVLKGDPKWQLLTNIIKSQIDIDRMDYLLRDAIMTGSTYGRFDLPRLLSVLELNEQRNSLVVQYKGLMAAEQFVFARYYAYWQIYFHKTTRGIEKILHTLWARAKELYKHGFFSQGGVSPTLQPFLEEKWQPEDYLIIDDVDIWQALKSWQFSSDDILSDLSRRVLNRELFKPVSLPENPPFDLHEQCKQVVQTHGYNPKYYLLWDRASDVAYDYYTSQDEDDKSKPPILVRDSNGKPQDITKLSDPVRAIAGKRKVGFCIYVPDENCRNDIKKLIESTTK